MDEGSAHSAQANGGAEGEAEPLTHVGEQIQALLSAEAPAKETTTETLQLLRQWEVRKVPLEITQHWGEFAWHTSNVEATPWHSSNVKATQMFDVLRRDSRTCCYDTASVPSRWIAPSLCQRCRVLRPLSLCEYVLLGRRCMRAGRRGHAAVKHRSVPPPPQLSWCTLRKARAGVSSIHIISSALTPFQLPAANAGSSVDSALLIHALHHTDCVSERAHDKTPTLPFELIELIFEARRYWRSRSPQRKSTGGRLPPVRFDQLWSGKRYSAPPAHAATAELRSSLKAKLNEWRKDPPRENYLSDDHVEELVSRAPRILAWHKTVALNKAYVDKLLDPGRRIPYYTSERLAADVFVKWVKEWQNEPIAALLDWRGYMKEMSSSSNAISNEAAPQALADEPPPSKRPKRACRT